MTGCRVLRAFSLAYGVFSFLGYLYLDALMRCSFSFDRDFFRFFLNGSWSRFQSS